MSRSSYAFDEFFPYNKLAVESSVNMKKLFLILMIPVAVIFLAACAGTPAQTITPTTPLTPTVTAALESPSATPTAGATSTPTAEPTTLYNRYVGKDATRQPELIQTPPVEMVKISEVDGYTGSYVKIFLIGKQVNGEDILGDRAALQALIKLFEAAHKQGFIAQTVLSCYRGFGQQNYLDEQSDDGDGTSVAEPGRSEHHLGTAVDLAWNAERLNFYLMYTYPKAREFYNWLKENAHMYGFVFSYPYKSNADESQNNLLEPYITEYKAEPWHLRYVGVELAKKIAMARDENNRGYLDPLSLLIPQQFLLPPAQ